MSGILSNGPEVIHTDTRIVFEGVPVSVIADPERPIDMRQCGTTVSDKMGNLLFYTNCYQVVNKSDQLMENGDSINFDYNGYALWSGLRFGSIFQQGLIALPVPTIPNEYYLIHINSVKDNSTGIIDCGTALLYSRIDMDGDNGLGAVVEKNQTVLADTIPATGLTATKHANGRDWWLLVFEADSKRLYRVLVTPEGVSLEGTQLLEEPVHHKITACAFSPNGSRFAIAQQKAEGVKHWLDVFDFDRCTGILDNHQKVYYSEKIHNGIALIENPAWGLSFSPNSRFVYLSLTNEVLQLDLLQPNGNHLQKTADYDGFTDDLNMPYEGLNLATFAFSRLAPDGRIYSCSTMPTGYFHVYEQPNEKGLASKVVQRGLELKGVHNYSIPNHPNYRLGPLEGSGCDTLGIQKSVFIHAHPYPMEGCVGGEAHFEVTAFGTGKSYLWQRSMDGGIVWEDMADDAHFTGTGTEYLRVDNVLDTYDGNMFRCFVNGDVTTEMSRPATLSVIGEFPIASISTENDLDKIYFSNGSIGDEYVKWYFGDGDSSVLENPSHVYQNMGPFTAALVATNACGTDTTYNEITIGPVVADFEADRTVGCPPMEVTFSSRSSYRVSNHNFNTTGASQGFVNTPHREATVTYNIPGIFDVGLTVYAPGPEIGETIKQDHITVLSGTNPTAEIDLQQNGNTVQLNASFDLADEYTWYFGNSDTLSGQMTEYTFDAPGLYQVQLETTNHCGSATGSVGVIVGELQPTFTVNQQQGCAPFTVQFENTTNFIGASYEWLFPYGQPATSTEENPTVVYETPGIYEVALIAHADSISDSLIQTAFIEVLADECPQANISVQTDGLEVTVWTDCTNGTGYSWDMGDGTTINTQGVAHQYGEGGTYEITLLVEGPCGTDTASVEVMVMGTSAARVSQQEKYVSLVPNPASGQVQVISEKGFANGASLKVFNAFGAQVLKNRKAVWKQQEVVALEGLVSGVYFFRFEGSDGQVQVGKLVVE